MNKHTSWPRLSVTLVLVVAASCGDDNNTKSPDARVATPDAPAPDAAPPAGTAQTPPTGQAAVDAWLALGLYKSWSCETTVHAARAPSPHGFNRVCSNTALSEAVLDSGEWPAGAAAVKELYDSATGTVPVGYAVYLKQAATSNAGANWYWYERVPGDGVVADGTGGSGPPKAICVGCHMGAGSDAAHTPSAHGRDQVYTPVAPQMPPTGQAAIEPWLMKGFYKNWSCETAVHAARSPSPHGFNRVCSNPILSEAVLGTSEWPAGAAAVKEIYASADGAAPVGYAVYLKQAATSNAGASWYWYERVPGDGVVADGPGGAGPPKTICVGCHMGAGSDAAHTPSAHGRDQVYTPVAPQLPPAGAAAVEPWLAKGFYKTWACEAAVHAARSPSPHGFNRICSNNLIHDNIIGTAPWPAGAAAVKELYASVDAAAPVGYAVYQKQAADSAAGANWYWYERVPVDGVVADGTGGAGPAKTICVGCHMGAGSDPAHTPTPNGRDQVYSPIP